MIRDDPRLDQHQLTTCLETHYGVQARTIDFVPLGYDLQTAIHRVVADDGTEYFFKTRFGPPKGASLEVPRVLTDAGIPNILAPIPTRSGDLWAPLGDDFGHTATLFPFLRCRDAMTAGMNDAQWREFGRTMRAVHDSGLHDRFRDTIRTEAFDLSSAALVRQVTDAVSGWCFTSPAAERFAAFWREHTSQVEALLDRAEELGRALQGRSFDMVLCHADIHAANILVADDGRIWLVDWDGPAIAPRERDLLFVVGSRIAREVTPGEERLFFEAYGEADIDEDALRYFRYERIIEDIGEIGKSIFFTPNRSDAAREDEAALARSFFAPGGDIARAEDIERA